MSLIVHSCGVDLESDVFRSFALALSGWMSAAAALEVVDAADMDSVGGLNDVTPSDGPCAMSNPTLLSQDGRGACCLR